MLSVILAAALTRAEIIERFRTPPVTMVNGLVQVFADCPREMRQEFQMPVAEFTAGICRKLEAKDGLKSPRFEEPGIVVYIGDVTTNRTDVIVRRHTRSDGEWFTRIYLPAPAFADVERLRLEVVKAFYLRTTGKEIDDADALAAIIASDPQLKIRDEYARLGEWLAGEGAHNIFDGADPSEIDEQYLKLARTIIEPGSARTTDVLRFASRLRLHSSAYDVPFANHMRDCTFKEAIDLAERDARIRLLAYEKAPFIVAYGGGRGDELAVAAHAYSQFLFDLASQKKNKQELLAELDDADTLLNIALEQARENEPEGRWK